jgi:hypothetical protein
MSAFAPLNELPREVNLVIHDFPEGITREVLKESLLSPYDDGSPSEFKAVTVAFTRTVDYVTHQAISDKTAFIKATFRDDIDDETLHYHLYGYAHGWALPIRMKHDGGTLCLFAMLRECCSSTRFLKDVLWERHEQQHQRKKRESTAHEDAMRLQLAEKEKEIGALREQLKRDNDHISFLHLVVGKKCSEVYVAEEALREKDELLIKQKDQFKILQTQVSKILQTQVSKLQNLLNEWTQALTPLPSGT